MTPPTKYVLKTINVCTRCSKEENKNEPLHLHHQIPRAMGGTDKDGRMYVCKPCHDKTHLDINKIIYPWIRKNILPEKLIDLKKELILYQDTMRKYRHFIRNEPTIDDKK